MNTPLPRHPLSERQAVRAFSEEEHQTWSRLYTGLEHCRASQAHPLFVQGVRALGLHAERIPSLSEVNERLGRATGWEGVVVDGLEDGPSFFSMLARREFPVGNFIREPADLSYTPAPDIFHDLYGHLPLLVDPEYAAFCAAFGVTASMYADQPAKLRQFERLFWFGVEFPLIAMPNGDTRIVGGGILSSAGESSYCLSDAPTVVPFDIEVIRSMEFRIDAMQSTLFRLRSLSQLYDCLGAFEAGLT